MECSTSATLDVKEYRVCLLGALICRGPCVVTKCSKALEVDKQYSCACVAESVCFASSLADTRDPRASRSHEEGSKTSVMKGKYGVNGEVDLAGFSNGEISTSFPTYDTCPTFLCSDSDGSMSPEKYTKIPRVPSIDGKESSISCADMDRS